MAKFLTSARAVDMLGRQQIAGIPTAVSEIFKNAYDAYALNVRGDYFPDRGVIVIRDDGVGMSETDFTRRWLTIGTDSKARDSTTELPRRPARSAERRQMGEKGIGRLAIASLGPQLLLVSRAMFGEDKYVVALVQWSFFEVPGLTLDDVVIPMRYIDDLEQLTPGALDEMRSELLVALDRLGSRVPSGRVHKIRSELAQLPEDVQPFLRLNGPNLRRGAGTAFIVSPVSSDVDSEMRLESGAADDAVSPFQRFLMGFANTMLDENKLPEMSTEFIVHTPRAVRDLIDPAGFWAPEDFAMTDHVIDGRFDELGRFQGSVSVYGGPPTEYVEPWGPGKGGTPSCGPFRIKFGYVQGEQSGSRLTGEQFALMTGRLNKLGGLYIYRDGIRVLPYGNSDKDYLEIEQRRTLNAGRYYFSYRRMFGAIELDSSYNPYLQEKAGREGFRENQAYRDFTSILRNFLIQMAATFFSAKTPEGEDWSGQKSRLKDRSSRQLERERALAKKRDEFSSEVERLLLELEAGEVSVKLSKLQGQVERSAGTAIELDSSGDLDAAERAGLAGLDDIRSRYSLTRPSTLALTADQEGAWEAFVRRQELLAAEILEFSTRMAETIERAEAKIADKSVDHPARRKARLFALFHRLNAELEGVRDELQTSLDVGSESMLSAASAELTAFKQIGENSIESVSVMSALAEVEIADVLSDAALRAATALRLQVRKSEQLVSADDPNSIVAIEEELLDLRSQAASNLELLQLGQAVEVVSHEFESNVRAIRSGLQELGPWGDSTPRLEPIIRDLRESFAHLDAYLRLFTPLQRRLNRQATEFSGDDIFKFVRAVFSERLDTEKVKLSATPDFRTFVLEGYPSTFYPAFVNLVDNAISWSSSGRDAGGQVVLEVVGNQMVVRDNGPGVRPRDADSIFERGFSRRRGGRGLGLSLAKDLLASDGWVLALDASFESGARFTLSPAEAEEAE